MQRQVPLVTISLHDPQIERFLNTDEIIDNGAGILGNNMFAYCTNNIVNMIDVDDYVPVYISGQALK
jgi:hypothetical protein